ncbi:hypothetical protein [Nostoc sp.]
MPVFFQKLESGDRLELSCAIAPDFSSYICEYSGDRQFYSQA